MASVVEDSSTRTPLIFVLSPGVVSSFVKRSCFSCLYVTDFLALFHEEMVNIPQLLVLKLLDCLISRFFLIGFHFSSQDPTSALLQLAENSGMSNRFHALSLGQGQAPIATRMIKEGVKDVSSLAL